MRHRAAPSTAPAAIRESLRRPDGLLAAALLILFTIAALAWPVVHFDNWTYHLPFSARLFGIGEADGFQLSRDIEQRWRGFPKAWEWIQGLFWALTGSLRAMVLPQLALCAGYFWWASKQVRVEPLLLVLGFFASPMLLVHFQSLYLDLPAGLCLALGFFLLLQSAHAPARSTALGAVLLLGLAGNIKTQALAAVLLIAATTTLAIMVEWGWTKKVARAAVLGFAAVVAASLTSLWNLQQFGNPLYPLEVQAAGKTLFAGPEDPLTDENRPVYDIGGKAFSPPKPMAFLVSATELDWTIRGVPPRYNIDSNTGDEPLDGGESRTGGWGWLFVLVNGAVLALQLARLGRSRDRPHRSAVIAATALLVATACLPRSHELRYWLYLPLIVLPLNLSYLARLVSARTLGLLLSVMALYALAQTILSPTSQILFFRPPLPGMSHFPAAPPELAAASRDRRLYCANDPLLFRHSDAVTGSRARLSQRLADCGGPGRLAAGAER